MIPMQYTVESFNLELAITQSLSIAFQLVFSLLIITGQNHLNF